MALGGEPEQLIAIKFFAVFWEGCGLVQDRHFVPVCTTQRVGGACPVGFGVLRWHSAGR